MAKTTNNGKKGGLLKGKPHYDKNGKSLGGIKAIVTDTNQIVELEGGEVIINKEASKKHWKELSRINQSAGDGVPILPPDEVLADADEYKEGGNLIQFNPNKMPSKWVHSYAKKIKENYPAIWDLGGNIYGNEAYNNLERVINRGHWLESEEWFFVKWQSFNARHSGDFLIAGVIANLKWLNVVDKGWDYMKDIIETEINKRKLKKMKTGGNTEPNGEKELLNVLEGQYLYDTRSLRLITDKKQLENNKIDWENDNSFIGKLYQYLKKYEIIGEYKIFYINDEEKIKDFQNRIKELKSNGYSVVQKISKPDKIKNKSYRFIAVKKMNVGGEVGKYDQLIKDLDKKELKMGVHAEQEHTETYQKIYDHEITPEEAPLYVAVDHLKEMDDYYTRLAQMEGMKDGGKIAQVMREFKEGDLKSSSGDRVTDIQQAIVIGLSEQRRYEAKKELGGTITCGKCGHSWHKEDNHTTKLEVCHLCGTDNSKSNNIDYNKVEFNQASKMEKSEVFYNPNIFVEEADFILGGFNTTALNGIKVKGDSSILNATKLEYIFKKRLKTALELYKEELKLNVIDSGRDYDNEVFNEEFKADIRPLLETQLGIKTIDFSIDNLVYLIISDSSYKTWSARVIERTQAFMSKNNLKPSDIVLDANGTVSVASAEELTEDISIEAILEQLGNINEQNSL